MIQLLFLFFVSMRSFVAAFQLNVTAPHQCSNLTATWQGGTPPYELLLVPVGHVYPVEIRTIISHQNITTSSYTLQLSYPQGSKFVAILSDATGAGTGGTTNILTVGPPLQSGGPGSSCLATTVRHPEFYFFLNPNTPAQCQDWQIAWPNTVQGISVWAVIPGKTTFHVPLSGAADPTDSRLESYSWTVDLQQGTQVLLVAGNDEKDGRGKGGSTDLIVVGNGTDSNCLSSSPLSSMSSSTTKPTGTTPVTNTPAPATSSKRGAALRVRSMSGLVYPFLVMILCLIL